MADFHKRRRFAFVFLTVILASGGLWVGTRNSHKPIPSKASRNEGKRRQTHASPRVSASPYLNTSSKAAFVGSRACVQCHNEAHQSFLQTAHSQALGDVKLAQEPPDVAFRHEKSGRAYRVYRKDGKLRHREVIPDEQGEIELGDYPVAYTIGSGHHSRSYLIKIDEFLVESPITWYASKKSWGLSPGYDIAHHPGFTRPANEGCIICHSGRVEPIAGSHHRFKFHEQKIGCESCHGPGSLHVEFRKRDVVSMKSDYTIVHPGRLSRTLNEAICARCHMRGPATVLVRGRKIDDFRPGLPLTDFRVDYLRDSRASMKVTGHFEQMYLSRCYTQSTSLTCTTCHNPHDKPSRKKQTAYYRSRCMACHETDGGCKLPEPKRLAQSPQNDCVSCHMPRVDTDIPHFAFTHHRIGLKHETKHEPGPRTAVKLKPVGDISRLPPLDRERCLGLAYFESSTFSRSPDPAHRRRAFELLSRVYDAGIRDAEVASGLALLFWELGSDRCLSLAREALSKKAISSGAQVNALVVLGDTLMRNRKTREAETVFLQLTTLRRNDIDWQKLGECRAHNNDPDGAVLAYKKSLAIRRDRSELHELLAGAYARTGRQVLAKKHRRLSQRLARLTSRRRNKVP